METLLVRFVPAGCLRKPVYLPIADDGSCGERRTEHQPLQRLATAQRHIRLPMRKG